MPTRVALLIVGLLTTLVGCSKIQEKLAERKANEEIEQATSARVEPDGGHGVVILNGEVVAQAGDEVKLPESWPADVPTYPRGALKAALAASEPSDLHYSLTYETDDSAEAILAFYKEKLGGYTKSSELVLQELAAVSYVGQGKVVSVTVSPIAGTSRATLRVLVTPKGQGT